MTTVASWLLALLWVSLLVAGEVLLVLALWNAYAHFSGLASYLRSAFDDPVDGKKMSMARVCALLSVLGALGLSYALVEFAFAFHESVGMATVLAGAIVTLGGTLGVALFKRTRADGTSETDDDRPEPPPQQPAAVVNIAQGNQ